MVLRNLFHFNFSKTKKRKNKKAVMKTIGQKHPKKHLFRKKESHKKYSAKNTKNISKLESKRKNTSSTHIFSDALFHLRLVRIIGLGNYAKLYPSSLISLITKRPTIPAFSFRLQKSRRIKLRKAFIKKINKNFHILFSHKRKKKQNKSYLKSKKPKTAGLSFRFQLPHFHPWVKRIALAGTVLGLVAVSAFYWFVFKDLPSPSILATVDSPQTTIIRDRNGQILYRVYKSANRTWLAWDNIPENVKKATVAIEDAEFYHHFGVSPKAILRAFVYNLQQQHINGFQGGSTITQQLVKNRLLDSSKTYTRKLKEVVLAIWTERLYSKQDILTFYLNEVGYGGPAYGIEAAAQMYFGKPAGNLTLAEAAFLSGLPAAPTSFSPFGANPDLATNRQNQVLERMLKLKMISETEYQEALNQKLAFAPQKIDLLAPHFVMYIKDQLVQKLGEARVTEGGLDVTTTLDLSIQQKAEEIVKRQITEIKGVFNIHNAGTLVTDPATGEILAMVGSVDYFDITNKGYVNVTTALRQPGSSIKPVNYAYAFDHGFSPSSRIEDAPVVYTAPGSKEKYAPVNYDGKFHGSVTLRSALANSYNIPAVKLLNSYGVNKMIELGKAMGIRSWNNIPPIGLSLTLGGAEVTMLDMARAYQTIANYGKLKDLAGVKEIRDNRGHDITDQYYESDKKNPAMVDKVQAEENQQVISPLASYWLIEILADNAARMPAFGNYAKLSVPNHKIAVKTGTSNNFRDNWTIGFSPEYLVATWVGNNDGSFMNKNLVSGITGAAPIWYEIMSNLLADKPPKDFPTPSGLIPVTICAVNGLLTCPNCQQEKTEYFTADKVPTQKCYFRPASECEEAKKQAEGKSDEERKPLLSGCWSGN